jgi:hypothetical protein
MPNQEMPATHRNIGNPELETAPGYRTWVTTYGPMR